MGSAAVGLSALGPAVAALAAVGMIGGVVVGVAVGRRGYAALYTYGIGRTTRAFEGLLAAVATSVEGGSAGHSTQR